MAHDSRFFKVFQGVFGVASKRVGGFSFDNRQFFVPEWQFEAGAFYMVGEDVGVARIGAPFFGGFLEKPAGVVHDKLVDGG
jgi:hypothetical protein